MSEQHLDRDQIDEDRALVAGALAVTVLEGVGQVVLGGSEVVVEHVLATHVELVRHLLRFWISVFQRRGFDGTNERFAEMKFVHSEVDLEQLVDDVQHSPSLCDFFGGLAVERAGAKTAHDVLGGLFKSFTRFSSVMFHLKICFGSENSEIEAEGVHNRQRPVVVFLRRKQFAEGLN